MRVFQLHDFYVPYLEHFNRRYPGARELPYQDRLSLLLADRFMAIHVLEPAYKPANSDFRFTVGNDIHLQRRWAEEHGLPGKTSLKEIALAQIEEHRTEVLYCLDPVSYNSTFVQRLPGCVKKKICWRAAPTGNVDFSAYDLRVCNFPSIRAEWERAGFRTAEFSPAHDPAMDSFAQIEERPVDIAFAGTYTSWFKNRNRLVEAVAGLSSRWNVVLAILHPRWRPLAHVRGLARIPTFIPYLPKSLRKVSLPPVFGIELYQLFGKSKIVINAAIDMAGRDRGNMRCFEAMGCGACMVSDDGLYPSPFRPGEDFRVFRDVDQLVTELEALLVDGRARAIGRQAASFMQRTYPKIEQWKTFLKLVQSI